MDSSAGTSSRVLRERAMAARKRSVVGPMQDDRVDEPVVPRRETGYSSAVATHSVTRTSSAADRPARIARTRRIGRRTSRWPRRRPRRSRAAPGRASGTDPRAQIDSPGRGWRTPAAATRDARRARPATTLRRDAAGSGASAETAKIASAAAHSARPAPGRPRVTAASGTTSATNV